MSEDRKNVERNSLVRVANRQDKKELKQRQTAARKAIRATFKTLRKELMDDFKLQKAKMLYDSDESVAAELRNEHRRLADADACAIHIAKQDKKQRQTNE